MSDDADSILGRYGEGSAFEQFPGTPSDTHWGERFYEAQKALHAGRPETTPARWPIRALRAIASHIPVDDREDRRRDLDRGEPWMNWWARTNLDSGAGPALAAAVKGGLNTTANWLEGKPEIGPDTAAPLGLAAIGTAPMGALAASAARRSPRQLALEHGREQLYAKGPNSSFPDFLEFKSPRSVGAGNETSMAAQLHPLNSSRASLPGTFINAMKQRIEEMRAENPNVSKAEMVAEIARMRREEFAKLYGQGMEGRAIAERLGLSTNDNLNILSKYRTPDMPRRRPPYQLSRNLPQETLDRVRDLRNEGKLMREVAAETGLSEKMVSNLRRKMRAEGIDIKGDIGSMPGVVVNGTAPEDAMLGQYAGGGSVREHQGFDWRDPEIQYLGPRPGVIGDYPWAFRDVGPVSRDRADDMNAWRKRIDELFRKAHPERIDELRRSLPATPRIPGTEGY